jgi:hypothetical protein
MLIFVETKGLSLEEINEVFGDDVVVHLIHISDEEKANFDATIGINEGTLAPISQKSQVLDDRVVTSVHVESN